MSSTDHVFICSDSSVSHGNVIIPLESIETNANEMNNLDFIGTSFSQPQQSPWLTLDSETLSSQQQQSSEELASQCKEESSLQVSSQHLVAECRIDGSFEKVDDEMKLIEKSMKRWTWNEVEKCWELMKNDPQGVDQLNGLDNLSNIESAETEITQRLYNQQQTPQQPHHQQINLNQFNANPDQYNSNSTQSSSSNQTDLFPSQPDFSSLDQFSGNLVQSSKECRIDGQEEKVDDEMKSIESSMKGWTWNEMEKCWELMKNGQIGGDEGNYEVGEECDDGENEEEDLDEYAQHGVDQLNRIEHESNIEVTVAQGDHRPNNINTSLTTPQSRDSLELLNDQSPPTSSYCNNTIPIQLEKSYDDNGLNKHSVYSSLPVTLDQQNLPTHLSTPLSDCTMFQSNALPSKSVSSSFDCDYPVSDGEIEVINDNQQLQSVIIEDNGLNGSNINENQQPQLCLKPIVHQNTELAQSKQNGQLLVPDKSTVKHICKKCGKKFTARSNLLSHFQIHSGVKPFACTWKDCGKTFVKRAYLKEHIRTHTGVKSFECTWNNCGKTFVRPNNLNVHIRTHSGEKPFICPWENCHKSFAHKRTMQVHHMAHYVEIPVNLAGYTRTRTKERLLLDCPRKDCGKTFVSKLGLKLHLESHAGISGTTNKHLCKYCGKTFKTSFILTGHFRTHTGEKPFKCLWKDCDKTFGQKSNLKTHFIGHSLRSIQRETIPKWNF